VVRRNQAGGASNERPNGPLVARLRDDRGVALTEFALILPVLMLLLIGMLDFGKAYNYWIDQTHLANEGARWAAVNKNPGGVAMTLQQYIVSKANTNELKSGGKNVSVPVGVCISFWRDGASISTPLVGDSVKVEAKATYQWLDIVGDIPILDQVITGSATMRIEQKPVNYAAGAGGTGATC
jgi:Flp pilus assembly protein TadG